MSLPDPAGMSAAARQAELAVLEVAMRRCQRRIRDLLAANSHFLACARHETLSERAPKRRQAPGPPPIVANYWGRPKRRAT